MLKITKNWSLIIFYSNTINFTEKLQETEIVYFLLIELYKFFQNFSSIFYWEYKLVQSVFFVHLFQNKMNESDQLKYYPSLPTTFSHLSGNFRIASRKNDLSLEAIQFWSQFSISAKEVNR